MVPLAENCTLWSVSSTSSSVITTPSTEISGTGSEVSLTEMFQDCDSE